MFSDILKRLKEQFEEKNRVNEEAPIENGEPYEIRGKGYVRVRVNDLKNLSAIESKKEIRDRILKVRQQYFDKYGEEFSESPAEMLNETMAHKFFYDRNILKKKTDISDMDENDFSNRKHLFNFFKDKTINAEDSLNRDMSRLFNENFRKALIIDHTKIQKR